MTNQMLVQLEDGRELSILKASENRLGESIELGVDMAIKSVRSGRISMEEAAMGLLYGLTTGDDRLNVLSDGINRFEVVVRKDGVKKGLGPTSWSQWIDANSSDSEYDIYAYLPREEIQKLMDKAGVVFVENPFWEVNAGEDSGVRGPEVAEPVSGPVHADDSVAEPPGADPVD
jgi:hypothetical protein